MIKQLTEDEVYKVLLALPTGVEGFKDIFEEDGIEAMNTQMKVLFKAMTAEYDKMIPQLEECLNTTTNNKILIIKEDSLKVIEEYKNIRKQFKF